MSRYYLCLTHAVLVGASLVVPASPLRAADELVPTAVQPQAPQPVCQGNCEKSQPQAGWFNATWFDVEQGACEEKSHCPLQAAAGWQPRSTAELEREVHQILEIMHQLGQGVLAGTEFDESGCESECAAGTCCASRGNCCAEKSRTSMAEVLRQVAASTPQKQECEEPISCVVATPCEPTGPVETLRQTARELDVLASQLEDQEQYSAADAIRKTAVSIRIQARDLRGQSSACTQGCSAQGATGCAGKSLNPHVTALELELELDVPR